AIATTTLGRLRDTPAFAKGRLHIAVGTRWELTFTSGVCGAEGSDAGVIEPRTDAAPVDAKDAAAGD
ncbi:MAG: hypothetical protein M3O46_23005, partial [Myxococcota bacterium]|nr:hypothetical protein [Myxococcota bacterium]